MKLRSYVALTLLSAVAVWIAGPFQSPDAGAESLPPAPVGWPSTFQIGMADAPGGASAMKSTAPFGLRYQYLSGGVNTGAGWANWNTNGNFVTYYVQDSVASGITPVFTYYQIYQSAPGNGQGEASGIAENLGNATTMATYWNDMRLFFLRAGAFSGTRVVLHVEPDLWGFTQQKSTNDDAATVPAKVGGSGVTELAGLPDNMSGFARAVDQLRDTYAPNVLIAYHMSTWGTGENPVYSNPSDATTDALATRAANYFLSLNGGFDLVFGEFSDRDAGFKQYQYGDGGASWWDVADFSRTARWLTTFTAKAQKRVVLWQIPLGNTRMRAMNNTWNHYQDNKVEWFLDDSTRTRLDAYRQAGVIAFLFGRGANGATCACDANQDGVTNPAPITGNNTTSFNADDDGGYFRQKAAAYYSAGAMPLGASAAPPPATATPVISTPTSPPAAPTATPAGATMTVTGVASTPEVPVGGTIWLLPGVISSTKRRVLVDVEVYGPTGARVFQRFYDNQSLAAGILKRYMAGWNVPANAAKGTYTMKVGIFTSGWGSLLLWTNSVVTFNVP